MKLNEPWAAETLAGLICAAVPVHIAQDGVTNLLKEYGDRRVAAALAEQKTAPDKPAEPTKLELVASAICKKLGHAEGGGLCGQSLGVARVAIEALKVKPGTAVQGGCGRDAWELPAADFNAWFDSILAEGAGEGTR